MGSLESLWPGQLGALDVNKVDTMDIGTKTKCSYLGFC